MLYWNITYWKYDLKNTYIIGFELSQKTILSIMILSLSINHTTWNHKSINIFFPKPFCFIYDNILSKKTCGFSCWRYHPNKLTKLTQSLSALKASHTEKEELYWEALMLEKLYNDVKHKSLYFPFRHWKVSFLFWVLKSFYILLRILHSFVANNALFIVNLKNIIAFPAST